MRVVASLVVGALGALLRFEMPAEAAGFKVHVIGVTLIVASVIGVVVAEVWSGRYRSARALSVS